MPTWAISTIESAIYNFFWDNKSPLTTCDVLALPVAEGGFNIHRIQSKVYALRLNTLRHLLDPTPAHWTEFTAHFLRLSNMSLGTLSLTTTFTTAQIDRDIPAYHQELLRAWHNHDPHHTRVYPPSTFTDILNKPLFRSALIQHDGKLLFNNSWITAGLTQIKNICYEAIPGLLPIETIHEIIAQQDGSTTRTYKTAKEYKVIIDAPPPEWLQVVYTQSGQLLTTPQPVFAMPSYSDQRPVNFQNGTTRLFSKQLTAHRSPVISSIQYW